MTIAALQELIEQIFLVVQGKELTLACGTKEYLLRVSIILYYKKANKPKTIRIQNVPYKVSYVPLPKNIIGEIANCGL